MNTVHLLGRLAFDPELRQTPSGTSVVSFSVAVSRGNKEKGTDFIRCEAWRESGENLARYFTKGKPIAIVWTTAALLLTGNMALTTFFPIIGFAPCAGAI